MENVEIWVKQRKFKIVKKKFLKKEMTFNLGQVKKSEDFYILDFVGLKMNFWDMWIEFIQIFVAIDRLFPRIQDVSMQFIK